MKNLWYDASCPICTAFKEDLERRLGDKVIFLEAEEGSKNFKYMNDKGTYEGRYAISVLMSDFPNISPSLMLLPPEWRTMIAKAVYEIASLGRKVIKSVAKDSVNKKGCGCSR